MESASVKQERKNITMDMTKGSPAGLLLRFALPLFIGNLLQQFYNLADTSIAGHMLGDQALAEIGATAALYSLITNFAFGMNNGLALTVSRNFGAGNEKKMKQAVSLLDDYFIHWNCFGTFRGLSAVSENTSGTA